MNFPGYVKNLDWKYLNKINRLEIEMLENERTVLVTGATGTQGGAVARNLLDRGWKVRALTRNTESDKALELNSLGAEVFKGDLNDPDSLKEPLDGVYGVFSVQNFWEAGNDGEIRLGKTLATAAKDAGVKHFVYTSVGSADKNTKINHFDSKFQIEEFIRSIDIPYTIIRPVFFMDNFFMMNDQISQGNIMNAVLPDVPLQMIASNDIGIFAAKVFDNPKKYIGRAIDIAGDSITMLESAKLLSERIGKAIDYTVLPMEDFRSAMGDEYATMVDWFNKVGYSVDIEDLERSNNIRMKRFNEWLSEVEF